MQSRGADPSIRTENYDPYLNPGKKLPVEVRWAVGHACCSELTDAVPLAVEVGSSAWLSGHASHNYLGQSVCNQLVAVCCLHCNSAAAPPCRRWRLRRRTMRCAPSCWPWRRSTPTCPRSRRCAVLPAVQAEMRL